MGMPETIQPAHLSRLAVVYVRQSSPHQTLANRESLKLQYDLQNQAGAAGWPTNQVRVIDTDLGRTGRSAEGRAGFQELVDLVNQGQVGIIFAYDVTRLARNCTDWYALLDLCGWRHCLVGDQDGIYDPATPNGRLILGLKGLISELELHTLRARLTAGLLSKARRGELAQTLPAGLIRDQLGRVVKHPSQEVQARLALVFATFLRVRAACHVVRVFQGQGLLLPRLDEGSGLVWRAPTKSSVLRILKNPAYAGCFAFGRTRMVLRSDAPQAKARQLLPVQEWKIRIPDKYPAYISWATFETIQGMLHDNHSEYADQLTRGLPRAGKALLHGLVFCGECGHKMVVCYKEKRIRYLCNYLRKHCHAPTCQSVSAAPLDAYALQAFFDALSPAELDLYGQAVAALRQDDEQLQRAQAQQLERLRYQARLAERQYNQADPDNRLVTAELEKRWEAALRELKEAETRSQSQQQPRQLEALSSEERETLRQAGQRLPELWRQGLLSPQQQKAFLRCLIDKVVVRRGATDTIQVRIVWKGGEATEATLPATLKRLAGLPGFGEMEKEILQLSNEGIGDEDIATRLTQKGYRSPRRVVLLPSTVRTIRLRHRQFAPRGRPCPRYIPGSLTVTQVADRLGVPAHWVHDRIHNGTIEVALDAETKLYLFPDKARTIAQFKQLQAGKVQKLRF
jgi:DNA invertase Pin-like site-specific DNA recombinase